jgi:hypothetical protein
MSMSTRVAGFAPPDEKWLNMKTVWDACNQAGVPVPSQVTEFFNFKDPDVGGVEIELPVHEWRGGFEGSGYELDIADIPPQVKTIRFWNSF